MIALYVCVYVCVHVYMYIYIYICLFMCICVHVYMCVSVCTVYICVHLFVCMYAYVCIFVYVLHAKSLQSCMTLCNPMNCSPPGSSVHGILRARILEWVAISSSKGSSQPRDSPAPLPSVALAGRFFTTSTT